MLLVEYAPAAPFGGGADAAAGAIRAVAAQVRRQLRADADGLALSLPALVEGCAAVEVNGRRLAVSWELGRALHDEAGRPVLGLCDLDPQEPDWVYLAVNGPMTRHRPDLALSTAAHELGHLVFDVPAALMRGARHYRAVAGSARALERLGRGAEARANAFMGFLLTPPVALHTRLLTHARSEGLRLARGRHQGRPASPIVAADNPRDVLAGIVAALAADFGVSDRFVEVRLAHYGLVAGAV